MLWSCFTNRCLGCHSAPLRLYKLWGRNLHHRHSHTSDRQSFDGSGPSLASPNTIRGLMLFHGAKDATLLIIASQRRSFVWCTWMTVVHASSETLRKTDMSKTLILPTEFRCEPQSKQSTVHHLSTLVKLANPNCRLTVNRRRAGRLGTGPAVNC